MKQKLKPKGMKVTAQTTTLEKKFRAKSHKKQKTYFWTPAENFDI